jgi:GNAT superfamily N-acetyltransferase
MLGGMELRRIASSDAATLAAAVEVLEACRQADAPWEQPVTTGGLAGEIEHGWDGEPGERVLATVDGTAVAVAQYETPMWDNRHLAWLGVDVHPGHRRRGHGSALLTTLLDRARAEGRTTAGIEGWEEPGSAAFAERHGFRRATVEVKRRQRPPLLDRGTLQRLHAEARSAARDYELLRWVGPVPAEHLAAVAELTAAINDAPLDDLDIEDEVFPPERITAYDLAQAGRHHLLHRVVARHRPTGALAGHTVVAVDLERPRWADQHDTSVVREHRGHRLGLLLKAEMLCWLAECQPQIEVIDTWNAASNDHMIAVNEALGYEVVARAAAYQRRV